MDFYPVDGIVQETWVEVANLAASWALAAVVPLFLIALALAVTREVRRQSLWCPAADRMVVLELVELGLPGFRRPTSVVSCSAFCPPTAVACDRRCLHATRRVAASAPPARS